MIRNLFLSGLGVLLCAACTGLSSQPLGPTADPTREPSTPTPEIFIALTQAVPAHVLLNDTRLAVVRAQLDVCDLLDCPTPPVATRYLAVTLQPVDPSPGGFIDYKALPAGIAIHDDTGALTAYDRLSSFSPETQQLVLYFTVPSAATVFGLQWPGAAEIPLNVSAD